MREDLVTAALELITREGPRALTLRAVAKRLGVTQTAPYRHFESKDALLGAVAAQGFSELLSLIERRVKASGADPVVNIETVATAYVEFALKQPAHFTVMYDARDDAFNQGEAVAHLGRSAFKLLIDLVVACQAAGRAAQGDASRIAVEIWSFAHGLVVLHQNKLLPRSLKEAELQRLAANVTLFLRDAR